MLVRRVRERINNSRLQCIGPSATTACMGSRQEWMFGFRGIQNPTNERTAIFTALPLVGGVNSLPVVFLAESDAYTACGFLAGFSSFVLDFVTRRKMGHPNLNFFIVKQLPVLPPVTYTPTLLDLIVSPVLELTYTLYDVAPFARDPGYDGPPFIWDEERRAHLREAGRHLRPSLRSLRRRLRVYPRHFPDRRAKRHEGARRAPYEAPLPGGV